MTLDEAIEEMRRFAEDHDITITGCNKAKIREDRPGYCTIMEKLTVHVVYKRKEKLYEDAHRDASTQRRGR